MLGAKEPKDINNRARTLLGDISSWSGASQVACSYEDTFYRSFDGVSVRLSAGASFTHRQATRPE